MTEKRTEFIDSSGAFNAPNAALFESTLQDHVLRVWFPRSLDTEYGGFLCDFDRRWKPCGPHNKLLEFQARQTLLAAEAAQVFPGDPALTQAAVHGFNFLHMTLWDREAGGWFHQVDRTGKPLEAHTKHTHGIAYAIHACVAVHRLTGNPTALALACDGFAWLEAYAHDAQYGGYFGFLERDGTPIREAGQEVWHAELDTINNPTGVKDLNTHSDLFEALAYLEQTSPGPVTRARLQEIFGIIETRALTPSGALAFLYRPDWTPLPHLVSLGTEFQTIHRLVRFGELLGCPEKTNRQSRRIMAHALAFGWDVRRGGFFFAAPATAPTVLEGQDLVVKRKSWWVQAEALWALLAMMQQDPSHPDYSTYFAAQWRFLQKYFLDPRYGGMYATGLDHLPRWRERLGLEFAPRVLTRKGNTWKDGSHDGRAFLACLAHFRSPPGSARDS